MIQLDCDNCERPFEADDADAGGKVACPFCGDVNRVPERASGVPEPAAREHGAEQDLTVVRPAMMRAHPLRGVLLIVMFIAGAWMAIGALATQAVAPWIVWPGVILVLLSLVLWGVWWVRTYLWIRLVVTNKRTVKYEGIIRRHSTEVLHDHVRSVDINQNFLQRIFKIGYLGIDSAAGDGVEIQIRDIPGPYEVKKLIDRYRKM